MAHKSRLLATILLLPCIANALPLQLRWTAETSDPKPFRADIWRGETVELRAQLRQYGVDVALPDTATASLYYQTNGMGSAWWQGAATATTNGLLSATWSPARDAGAGSYVFFIGAADAASNVIYRAHGQIRMLGSPGATPNALEPPVQTIDFGTTATTNAPWLLTELDPVAGAALAGHTAASNPHGITPAGIGALPITGGTVVGRLGSWDGYSSYSTSLSPYAAILKYSEEAGAGITKHHEISLTWEGGIYQDQEPPWLRRQWMWPRPPKKEMLLTESDIIGLAPLDALGGYLPLSGGVMTGAITLAAEGVAFHGVNVSSNFVIKAEYDGTNVNFNVYGVAR